MRVPWRLAAIANALCLAFPAVQASSQSRNPLTYLTFIENPSIQTPSHRVHASSHFDLHFNLHQQQQRIKLTLEPNHDILPQGASITYLSAEGQAYRTEEVPRHEHKIFKGEAWVQGRGGNWIHAGWARIVVRRDGVEPLFEGAFSISHDHHHIQLRSYYESTKHELDPEVELLDDEYMVLWRDSDIGYLSHQDLRRSDETGTSCLAGQMSFNTDPSHPIFAPPQTSVLKRSVGYWGAAPVGSLFGKRQIDTNGIPSGGNGASVNLRSSIGSTAGCPTTRKVALVGVATDCSYTGTFNSSQSAHQNVITQINSASDVYERTFNITLGLANLTVIDAGCPGTPSPTTPWNIGCAGNISITDRLNLFSQWRGERNDSNAYWTLLTDCNTGAEVGLAWLGQFGVQGVQTAPGEVVSGANIVAKTPTEWQVIAHESGHTFGAVHDCDASTCANSQVVNAQQCCPLSSNTCDAGSRFIMNPSTGRGITDFSPCSIGNICSALGRNSINASALVDNKGVTTITGQQCGNGIVEDGEDCDCGGTASCGNNTCCDATTCRFIGSAVCDDSNEDCCRDCQFASEGVVCRASTGQCDPQETCSGRDANCPADQTAPDGDSCGNGADNLQCASGQCTSRDQQCKTLMGSYTSNNDTYACNSQDCALSCASPEFGRGVCYSMQQNFLDGTVCGGGGRCSNGQCRGSSTGRQISSWIHDNRNLVIGICAGVGGFLLLAILGCCCRRCRRPSKASRRRQQPMPPPPMMSSAWPQQPQRGWEGTGVYGNGGWGPDPPPVPQHRYGGQSVRYA